LTGAEERRVMARPTMTRGGRMTALAQDRPKFDPWHNAGPGCSDAEWQARVDLAAGHRLVGHFGWSNLVYNHFLCRVPGEPSKCLVKPNDLTFEEVTASSLVKIDLEKGAEDPGAIQASGFNIHTGVLLARPDVNASLHVHTEAGMAVAAQQGGLLPLSQTALRFYRHLGVHSFEGIATQEEERHRVAQDLGPFKAMLLLNHGLLTCGKSVCEAIVLMKFLVTACEVQLRVQASGAPTITPSEEACMATARHFNAADRDRPAEWPAMIRMLDRIDTSYRN
jgi:ribulose-5-phosphate 4-epimerase/fuculose-1-phosphate aldolase